MVRPLNEEDKRPIAFQKQKCKVKGCGKDIEFVHVGDFSQGGGANVADYYCAEHSKQELENI